MRAKARIYVHLVYKSTFIMINLAMTNAHHHTIQLFLVIADNVTNAHHLVSSAMIFQPANHVLQIHPDPTSKRKTVLANALKDTIYKFNRVYVTVVHRSVYCVNQKNNVRNV